MNKKSKLINIILLICLSFSIFGCGNSNDSSSTDQDGSADELVVIEDEPLIDVDKYVALFDEDKAINSDVQAILVSPSGLIEDQVIVKSSLSYSQSAEYLRKDWKTGNYLSGGTCFIDGRNSSDENGSFTEQNTIIYGHYVYHYKDPDQVTYFTPLHKLKDKDNYEENKYFVMVYENEIIEYEVVSVFYATLVEGNDGSYTIGSKTIPYYYINYDETTVTLADYVSRLKDSEFYDIGATINQEDKLLTLNTCVEYHDELRLNVVCKKIKSYTINR